MITVTLFWPTDRRCSEYDAGMPALISSIFLSNNGEIFAEIFAVVVEASAVEDSNSW
jgi:hypothetical protein